MRHAASPGWPLAILTLSSRINHAIQGG